MKKFLLIIAASMAFTAFAQERLLFDAANISSTTFEMQETTITNEAEEWTVEFPNQGVRGHAYPLSQSKSSDRGIAVKVEINGPVPEYVTAVLKPNIIAPLTESEAGSGKITNVGAVKKVTISGFSLNYDLTVRADMRMSDRTKVGMGYLKPDQYGEFELSWENPSYIGDPKKRDIKPSPVYPNIKSDLYLDGIEIRGKPVKSADGTGYMFFYINKITVVADKAYEELDTMTEELFGIEKNNTGKDIQRQQKLLERKEKEKAAAKTLMAEETGEE